MKSKKTNIKSEYYQCTQCNYKCKFKQIEDGRYYIYNDNPTYFWGIVGWIPWPDECFLCKKHPISEKDLMVELL